MAFSRVWRRLGRFDQYHHSFRNKHDSRRRVSITQDGALNARDPFETESGKPSFRRFRAGFALGGPVIEDKTF